VHTSLFPLVYIDSVYRFSSPSILDLWSILSQSQFTKSSTDIHFSITVMNRCAKAARLAPRHHGTPRFDIGLPFDHLSMDGLHAVRAKYKADDEKPDSMNDRTLLFSKGPSSPRSSFEDAWAKFASQYCIRKFELELSEPSRTTTSTYGAYCVASKVYSPT
jgi:hypothetical protein